MNCADCAASGIESPATRKVNGKGYCSSHARKYFPAGAQLPPQITQITQIEEEDKNVENEAKVCRVEGCEGRLRSDNHTGYCRAHANLKRKEVDGGARRRTMRDAGAQPPALLRASHLPDPPLPLALERPGSASANGNGHARCRVAMFEVDGDAEAVRHAVDAIKAALENRSA